MLDLDDLANFDILGTDGGQARACLRGYLLKFGQVQFFVPLQPLEVIISLFEHRDGEDENQRCHIGEEQSNLQEGHELRKSNEQKEHVEEELELVVEQEGQEADEVVLLVVQLV